MLQIHDEIAFSVADKKAAEEAAVLMRDSVKLLVPSRVDVEVGTSWGDSMG
jgi:DNA polymerase I-like protein with 3'-5' exonuclease and polymerase domains